LTIDSTRFGTIEISDDAVLTFPDGLVGLPGTRYALIAQHDHTPFFWLHSADEPAVALPVTSPWLWFPAYEVRVSDDDQAALELAAPEEASILCVVRAAGHVDDFTVNLLAPVIVHAAKRIGRQVINEATGYDVRQPLFAETDLDHVESASPGVPVAAWAG